MLAQASMVAGRGTLAGKAAGTGCRGMARRHRGIAHRSQVAGTAGDHRRRTTAGSADSATVEILTRDPWAGIHPAVDSMASAVAGTRPASAEAIPPQGLGVDIPLVVAAIPAGSVGDTRPHIAPAVVAGMEAVGTRVAGIRVEDTIDRE